jgi:hypothetical protein
MCNNERPQTIARAAWIAAASLGAMLASNPAHAACASTRAEAAASSTVMPAPLAAMGERGGFRVISIHWDPILHQRWAQVASCAHPEWPTVELPTGISLQSNLSQQSAQQPSAESVLPMLPVVHAGDIVQLWSREDDLRIEVAAIAEQSGALGQPVRVRLMQRATLGQQIEEQFNGVVRGPHDVEMQR